MHKIHGLDIKGWRSYIVAPGCVHPLTGQRYEYVSGKELTELNALPVFDPVWVKEIREEPLWKPQSANHHKKVGGHIRDVRAYIRGIASIEGQGGDRACFRVACLLVEAGFDFDSAVAEINAWNEEAAFPPWENTDLERKVRYAFKRVLGRDIGR
jgi:hypothetical protein